MNKKTTMKHGIRLSLLLCATALSFPSLAAYPDRPIDLIVPFAPGGNLDITARAIAPVLAKALHTKITVENKPGAGGVIGAGFVARSRPDGYTILVSTPNAIAVAPYMTKAPYKPADFRAIGLVAKTPLLIDVNSKSKFTDIKGFLKYACANPGKITVGHSGIGTTNYMGLIALEEASKCHFTAIPYKGSGPALVDLMGGQIDAVVDQLSSSSPLIHSGKLKALAVLTAKRVPSLSDVPTLAESGVEGIDASTNTGLLVPVKTPSAIVKKLNEALRQVAASKAVKSTLGKVGSTAESSTPDAFMTLITNEDKVAAKLSAEGKLRRK